MKKRLHQQVFFLFFLNIKDSPRNKKFRITKKHYLLNEKKIQLTVATLFFLIKRCLPQCTIPSFRLLNCSEKNIFNMISLSKI